MITSFDSLIHPKCKAIFVKYLLINFLLLPLLLPAQNLSEPHYYLHPDSLLERGETYIGNYWKYKSGDNQLWASSNFDDSNWETVYSTLNNSHLLEEEFNGVGWFRLHLLVDSALINQSISFDLWLSGAAEVYLNGEQIQTYGKIENGEAIEKHLPVFPKLLSFTQTNNLIAIRFFNNKFEEMLRMKYTPGFALDLGYPIQSIKIRHNYLANNYITRTVFVTIPIVLAIVHFFLFLFDRKKRQNFFYVLFLLSFALFIYTNLKTSYGSDIDSVFTLYRFAPFALIATILFGSTSIHSIYKGLENYYKYILAVGLVLGITAYFMSASVIWYLIYIYITSVSIWGSQLLYNPKCSRNTPSDWIIRIGFAIMAISGIYQMLLSLDIISPLFGFYMPFVYGVLIFILSMSISLARDFASTSKNLEKKLVEVKELSERTLTQELEAKELEIEKRILEADNKRKTDELEAARTVQLAMLPQCLNDIEGLDICFDMHPATEVGGDYYDYTLTENGTLNLVIGDATGHGMKAGIMVATIKSLFSALGIKLMIPEFFKRCTEIIKNMSLGNLFMSMTFLRIQGNRIIGSLAGMPPVLIYRKAENVVEEILQKSMPLGSPFIFPYEIFETEFNKGDVILLITDGFIELFNTKKEMLGFESTKEYFKESVNLSANDLVQNLVNHGKEWRGEHPQSDDITFVAIKKK